MEVLVEQVDEQPRHLAGAGGIPGQLIDEQRVALSPPMHPVDVVVVERIRQEKGELFASLVPRQRRQLQHPDVRQAADPRQPVA